MAKIEVLSSGSFGNSYILSTKEEKLLIELGIPWDRIVKCLNYQEGFRQVKGCISTHRHFDHIKPNTLKKALSRGLQVYSCKEVCDLYSKVHLLELGKKYKIGGFYVQPFSLPHNAENYGYIIEHEEFGKLVFATDCSSFLYKIKNVNHWLIEANYSDEIMIDNACDNIYSRSASENHLEINQTIDALKANYSSSMENVVLLHLSNGNSNEKQFIEKVKSEIGIDNVYVAKEGLVVDLNKDDF